MVCWQVQRLVTRGSFGMEWHIERNYEGRTTPVNMSMSTHLSTVTTTTTTTTMMMMMMSLNWQENLSCVVWCWWQTDSCRWTCHQTMIVVEPVTCVLKGKNNIKWKCKCPSCLLEAFCDTTLHKLFVIQHWSSLTDIKSVHVFVGKFFFLRMSWMSTNLRRNFSLHQFCNTGMTLEFHPQVYFSWPIVIVTTQSVTLTIKSCS